MGTVDSPLPRMLGRYALYEKIASGGMASVHIGRLVGPVGFARTVAIKRMHPQFAEDPEFVSMFLDEARLAARIRHPNVVPTLDVVAMEGELFLVMDFVQGESLGRLVRTAEAGGEHIPPAITTTIVVGVLHGLHAAHEAKNEQGEPLGVVHRDVSPQNVLVGVDGVSRVLDFGVAKAVGRLQTTREGQLKGKLAYMAPEQLRGDVTRVSDVYAASVVLWEALTGKRLFRGDNEAHVFEQVLKGCQEPPSAYAPGLPSALDAVTMRGLSVDPALRFTTAREMACALEEAITPATASKIGDWVERAAKTTLDERTARIASIESDSSVQAPRVPPSSPDLPRSLREAPNQMIPVILADGSGITQLSSGSISSPARKSSRGASLRARPRTAWLVGVCGVFFLGGAFALGKGMSGAVPAAPASPAPQPLASAADPVPPAPSTPSADPGIDVASPREDGTDLPSPQTSKGAASAVPAGANLKPVLPITRAPRAPTVNCDPPYTINAAGHRVRKPECH